MNIVGRKIAINLFDDFYKLKCDPVNVAWTGHQQQPDKERLEKWFRSQIDNIERDIFLFYNEENVCVGYSYIDYLNEFTVEESIGVFSEFSGRGIATKITQFEIEYAKKKGSQLIVSWISENNIPSVKRLLKYGFQKTEEIDYRDLPLLGGQHKFYKYIKNLHDTKV